MKGFWLLAGMMTALVRPGFAQAEAGTVGGAGKEILARDDFRGDLSKWVVEQQPGGTVAVRDGALVIEDKGGCTVWLREPLQAPVRIRYTATVTGGERVSDLNCFWMATYRGIFSRPRADETGNSRPTTGCGPTTWAAGATGTRRRVFAATTAAAPGPSCPGTTTRSRRRCWKAGAPTVLRF